MAHIVADAPLASSGINVLDRLPKTQPWLTVRFERRVSARIAGTSRAASAAGLASVSSELWSLH